MAVNLLMIVVCTSDITENDFRVRSAEVRVVLGGRPFNRWVDRYCLIGRLPSINRACLLQVCVRVAGVVLFRKFFHGVDWVDCVVLGNLLIEEIEDGVVAQHVEAGRIKGDLGEYELLLPRCERELLENGKEILFTDRALPVTSGKQSLT